MSIEYLVRQKRNEILRIAERHGAYNVRVFGSVARGEAGPDSDVDLLIDAGETVSPWFPGGLVLDLEELLGRRVDVVEEVALRGEVGVEGSTDPAGPPRRPPVRADAPQAQLVEQPGERRAVAQRLLAAVVQVQHAEERPG